MSTVADRIRTLRERKAYSQAELAELAEVSPSTIYQVEAGKARPRGRTLRRIAEALGVDVEALTVGQEQQS